MDKRKPRKFVRWVVCIKPRDCTKCGHRIGCGEKYYRDHRKTEKGSSTKSFCQKCEGM